ncbi:MAG: hypothetical protein APR63_01660 [Desulfuromonas sp. SDB]|nr:MAG: hypothetical protein APR63_01660 [Desulfuromonas sp. SDB]
MLKTQFSIMTFLLSLVSVLQADAGPAIPLPEIRVEEAICLGRDYFLNQWDNPYERTSLDLKDFIIQQVIYTNYYRSGEQIDDEIQEQWIWLITFIHPVANDHTMTFQIDSAGEISLYNLTI